MEDMMIREALKLEEDEEYFEIAQGVKAGESVPNGYAESTAPKAEGTYNLYQIARDNEHVMFAWLRQ